MRNLILMVIGLGACCSVMADTMELNSDLEVSRYISVKAETTQEQRDLMSVIVQLHFPKKVQNVADALDYALLRSGYIIDNNKNNNLAKRVLNQQLLPRVHRQIGPATLIDIIQTLAGPAFKIEENPLLRTIQLVVKDSYMSMLNPDEIEKISIGENRKIFQERKVFESKASTNQRSVKIPTDEIIAIADSPFINADAREHIITAEEKTSYSGGKWIVSKNEALWDIAATVRPSKEVSIPQVMDALLLQNPDAFLNGDINQLYEGSTLTIPTIELIKSINTEDEIFFAEID